MGAMRDVMIDLETWGKRPGCALRSIGAVVFDPRGEELGDEFYVNVTRDSCEEIGLHVDPDTEAWWARQSSQAQDSLTVDPLPIRDAINKFCSFWRVRALSRPWSQGANFDQPILEEVMRLLDARVPWKFWDSRCTRTAYGMAGMGKFDMPKFSGTAHNALDDALHQARCVQLAHKKLGLR